MSDNRVQNASATLHYLRHELAVSTSIHRIERKSAFSCATRKELSKHIRFPGTKRCPLSTRLRRIVETPRIRRQSRNIPSPLSISASVHHSLFQDGDRTAKIRVAGGCFYRGVTIFPAERQDAPVYSFTIDAQVVYRGGKNAAPARPRIVTRSRTYRVLHR